MTIRKGEDWGSRRALPDGAPVVSSDIELASLFTVGSNGIEGPDHVGLNGGDLARTVGAAAPAAEIRDGERVALPIDVAVATVDGTQVIVVSSLVIRRWGWFGLVQGAMNASFLGDWNVIPAGHPNDGRFDVVSAQISLGDWWKARARLPLGEHLPHPRISVRRLKKAEFEVPVGARVWVDGRCLGRAKRVELEVFADATTVVI